MSNVEEWFLLVTFFVSIGTLVVVIADGVSWRRMTRHIMKTMETNEKTLESEMKRTVEWAKEDFKAVTNVMKRRVESLENLLKPSNYDPPTPTLADRIIELELRDKMKTKGGNR